MTTDPANSPVLSPEARRAKDAAFPAMLDALAQGQRDRRRRRVAASGALAVALVGTVAVVALRQGPAPATPAVPAPIAQAPAPIDTPVETPLAGVPDAAPDHGPLVQRVRSADLPASGVVKAASGGFTVTRVERERYPDSPRVARLTDMELIDAGAEIGQAIGVAIVDGETVAVGWEPVRPEPAEDTP